MGRKTVLQPDPEDQGKKIERSQRKEEREVHQAVLSQDPDPGREGRRKRNTNQNQNIKNLRSLKNPKRNQDTVPVNQKMKQIQNMMKLTKKTLVKKIKMRRNLMNQLLNLLLSRMKML